MDGLEKNRLRLISLTFISLSASVCAWGSPLERLSIYQQQQIGIWGNKYSQNFLILEDSLREPFGFEKEKAKLIAHIYKAYPEQKLGALFIAFISSGLALKIGGTLIPELELDEEAKKIKRAGKREVTLSEIKHRMAMTSKTQRLLFLDEIKALMEEFGSEEEENIEIDEALALYDEAQEALEEEKPDFRELFPKEMDLASKKAAIKAREDGASLEEIAIEILSCPKDKIDVGLHYLRFLEIEKEA